MIETDDCEPEDSIEPWVSRPAILPTQAKDMIGFSGELVRSYVDNGMTYQLKYDYGINEDEAWLSLKCADLATLRVWDAEVLLEAATVYLQHGIAMAARYSYAVEGNVSEDVERTKRRIRLAMLAEKAPEVMSPADGVLLLRRTGINVFHELLDAVAVLTLEPLTPESQSLYRVLKGIPEPKQTALATDTALPALVVADGDSLAPPTTAPAWRLITSLARAPGYRWPLYQFLKAAHAAGKPCPKARDVVDAWTLKPPPDVQAMPDGVKYNGALGNQKEANLKAIQQSIKALLQKEAG